jgi:hypothetical protein
VIAAGAIVFGYIWLVAMFGWPGLLAAALHITLLLLTPRG